MTQERDELKLANIAPPLFVCVLMGTIWCVYTFLHVVPLLQFDLPRGLRNEAEENKGICHFFVAQTLVTLLLISYARAFLTAPGSVPEDGTWKMGFRKSVLPSTFEMKESGERRHCKWCLVYKPDRCHHCRICNTCVLKMDHHCPWIMNCVGFNNHKFFFLLVVYAVLCCWFMTFTMMDTVHASLVKDIPPANRFLLVLGVTLTITMGVFMGMFLVFHIWLMLRGMSTIEFCEKSAIGFSKFSAMGGLTYDRGIYKNVVGALGSQPLLWFLPVRPPTGDGISYSNVNSDARRDPEWTGRPYAQSAQG